MCIGEMAKKAKKEHNYIIRCTHCMTEDYKLHDVDLNDNVKHYTDTPAKFNELQNNYATPGEEKCLSPALPMPNFDSSRINYPTPRDLSLRQSISSRRVSS